MKLFTKNSDDIVNNKVYTSLIYLILLSFILIPFDDLSYLSKLSGVGRRAALYPFFLIIPTILFLSLKKLKLYFEPSIEKILLLLFYSWVIISIGFNLNNILNSSFKNSNGISKMLIHLITFTFMLLVCYCSEIIFSKGKITLYNIRTAIAISLIPVAIVSLMEVIHTVNLYDLSTILKKISYAVNSQMRGYVYGGRSRAVSAEASYLGMYCAFIFPWILSYVYTEKSKVKKALYIILSFIIMLIVIATKSRTAYILILFELVSLAGCILLFYSNKKAKIFTVILLSLLALSLFIYPKVFSAIKTMQNKPVEITKPIEDDSTIKEPTKNEYDVNSIVNSVSDTDNLSNIARSTMQHAAIGITIDHPLFGVGLGQFGFNFSPYIKESSLRSNEVKVWLDPNTNTWPPVHSLYHRLASETGLVGLLLYVSFIFIICLRLFIKIIKSRKDLFGIFLLISYCSILIGSLTVDTFLLTQFWLMTPLLYLYTRDKIAIK